MGAVTSFSLPAAATEPVKGRDEIRSGRCQIDVQEHIFDAAACLHRMPEQLRAARPIRIAVLVAVPAVAGSIVLRRSYLVDGHRALDDRRLARHPSVLSEIDDVFQHESNSRRQVHVVSQKCHSFEVLVHQLFALVCVQDAAAGPQNLAEALQVL